MNIYENIFLVVGIVAFIVVSCIFLFLSYKEHKVLNLKKKEFELRVYILESELESLKDVVNKNEKSQ